VVLRGRAEGAGEDLVGRDLGSGGLGGGLQPVADGIDPGAVGAVVEAEPRGGISGEAGFEVLAGGNALGLVVGFPGNAGPTECVNSRPDAFLFPISA
jgi:hypothetical protein